MSNMKKLENDFRMGRISRRDFLKAASMMGVASVGFSRARTNT